MYSTKQNTHKKTAHVIGKCVLAVSCEIIWPQRNSQPLTQCFRSSYECVQPTHTHTYTLLVRKAYIPWCFDHQYHVRWLQNACQSVFGASTGNNVTVHHMIGEHFLLGHSAFAAACVRSIIIGGAGCTQHKVDDGRTQMLTIWDGRKR